MAIPENLLATVQAYCQEPAPGEADLLVLNQAWDMAAAYLAGADVSQPAETDRVWPLWLQVMLAMVLDIYDQRGAQFEQGKLQANPAWRSMKNQLKFAALGGSGGGEDDP